MLKRLVSTLAIVAIGSLPLNVSKIPTKQAVHHKPASQSTSRSPSPIISYAEILNKMQMPKFQELPQLSLADFNFDPMGTYSNSYDPGQCTWGVASMKGDIPNNWGNAANWATAARDSGYTVSNVPIIGAVGVSFANYYGHVVVVTGTNSDGTLQITEMNYDGYGDGLWHIRTANVSEFTYIYI